MGARLINNPRRTKIGHVEAFPVLHMRSLRKSAMFSEGQRTEGHFRYPGASNAITIIVDLRSEHDLKVLLKVGHADSATNMQVIGLTHRPTGLKSVDTIAEALNRTTFAVRRRANTLRLPLRKITRHLNDDKSPLIGLMNCIVCGQTMKIEKSSPDAEGKDIIQYRCGRCDRIERVRLFRRSRDVPV